MLDQKINENKRLELICLLERTSSPVCQAVVDAIARKLARARLSEDKITLKTSVDDLGDDVFVREADDEAVLGGVVLVLGLGD